MIRFYLFLFLIPLICFNIYAKKHDNGKGKKNDKTFVIIKSNHINHSFSPSDKDIIIKFFQTEHKKLPPGQLKKKHYKIIVGSVPSKELIKVFTPLPPPLIPLLPPPPPGIEFFMAGDQIVSIDKKSHKVLDCFIVPIIP